MGSALHKVRWREPSVDQGRVKLEMLSSVSVCLIRAALLSSVRPLLLTFKPSQPTCIGMNSKMNSEMTCRIHINGNFKIKINIKMSGTLNGKMSS